MLPLCTSPAMHDLPPLLRQGLHSHATRFLFPSRAQELAACTRSTINHSSSRAPPLPKPSLTSRQGHRAKRGTLTSASAPQASPYSSTRPVKHPLYHHSFVFFENGANYRDLRCIFLHPSSVLVAKHVSNPKVAPGFYFMTVVSGAVRYLAWP